MASHIYHGPWVNFNNGGYIRGATVTLSDQSGGLLTTFIATFVTLVGAQLWKILAFAIHQIRSTTEPEDGLFHQQQAIWRNTPGPGGASWIFLQQAWYWRSKANRAFLRTFSWSVFSALYLVLFALAAVFSSQISKAPGSERLVIGKSCGYWTVDNTSPNVESAYFQKLTNDSQVAATYAKACYGGNHDTLQCSRFPVSSLSWISDSNATCPFQSGTCYYGDTAAFEMTSQLLDSQLHLGINTPDKDRLQFQKRTTCAPIRPKDFINITHELIPQDDGTYQNDTFWNLMFGPWSGPGPVNTSSPDYLPQTDFYNTQGFRSGVGYQVSTVMAVANNTNSKGWRPVPQIFRDDADVTLFFLEANAIRYNNYSDDPLFSAHVPFKTDTSLQYYADLYVNTVGCAEQYRYCNPNNNVCSPYRGYLQTLAQSVNSSSIAFNTMQQMTIQRMQYAAGWSSMYRNVYPRSPGALVAQETVVDGVQTTFLSSTHWHTEMSSWFDTGLAAFQQKIIEYATGPSNLVVGAKLLSPFIAPVIPQQQYQCFAQIIKDSSDTMSFSVLGMALLFILGGIIIFTSLIIDRLIALLQRWFKFNLHGARAWQLDDKLQMQRAVFEKSGIDRWKEDDDDSAVPVTVDVGKFRRFAPDQLFGEKNPDGPLETEGGGEELVERRSHHLGQKTEYVGHEDGYHGREPGVYIQGGR